MTTYNTKLALPIVDPLQRIYADNYANNTGNALTNPRRFMEQTLNNINANSKTPINYNNDLVDMAVKNYDFEQPNYGEERKFGAGGDPLSFADSVRLRTSLGDGAPGRKFAPIQLKNDIRQNKLAMGQGLLGLLANKPKGGMLSGWV